ncbi:DUF4198 domain-containing protein [Novosphingobium sp. FSY-8]|uniref:DUF4198 domain-containing protein n=2 Tax=Novosphingobium ovatum TaxID=1908523 RepID=A0ABW9XD11_9SPHN|nr:DUF4198 domain-containing protein [Novosphingobium ovatum]
MKRSTRLFAAGLGLAGAAFAMGLASNAQAHGIWFAQRARQIALVFGLGGDDLDMVRRMPRLTSVTAYDADGAPVAAQLVAKGAIPIMDATAPYAIAAATMDYGVWAKRPDGEFEETTKDKVPNAVLGERTFKYAVFLAKPLNKPLALLPGHKVQIVPLAKDIPQKKGQMFAVRVYFDGKPFKGAQILPDFVNDPDMTPIKTDAAGIARFPMRNQGLNVIAATIIEKSSEPVKYDYTEYRASLSFMLPHAAE